MNKPRTNITRIAPALLLAALLALLPAQAALAHTRVEVGPYVLVVGWEKEPVIVGERNAVILQITEDDAPVTGAEGTLDLALEYAGRTYRANLAPTAGQPGWYRAEVLPTVRGQYTVHLSGAIGDTALDERVEPEEVAAGAVLQFPEPVPDNRELSETMAGLEARLSTAYALAIGGIAVGIVGIGLAAFSIVRRRP
jgi:hypothetical protein